MNASARALLLSLSLLAAGAASAHNPDLLRNGKSIYGETVEATQTQLRVDVTKQDYINIDDGQSVTFSNGSKSFSWRFDVLHQRARVDLRRIAPAGFVDRPFIVYVSPNEWQRGG